MRGKGGITVVAGRPVGLLAGTLVAATVVSSPGAAAGRRAWKSAARLRA
jgi:hypothetical protein